MDDSYQIIRQTGRSPWCNSYLAEQRQPNRPVVFKLLHGHLAADAQKVERFKSNAQLLKALNAPHIPALLDSGINDFGQAYLVYEFFRGITLAEYIQQGTPPLETAVSIARQLLEALAAAHQAGIVHGDLRPQSIILVDPNEGVDVQLYDFSLPKLLSMDNLSFDSLTTGGVLVGSTMYMSPEQCLGEAVGAASDVYSFGCIFYELLSGQTPFQDASGPFQTVQSHLHLEPLSINKLHPGCVSTALDALVMRCLCKKPQARFQSAVDALAALNKIDARQAGKSSKGGARLKVAAAIAAMLGLVCWWSMREANSPGQGSQQPAHSQSTLSEAALSDAPESAPPPAVQPAAADRPQPGADARPQAQQYCNLGAASFRHGDLVSALRSYSLALQLNPDLTAAYEGRALVYIKSGKLKEALADGKAYIERNPKDAAAFYCLGRLYSSLGDDENAEACLTNSLKLAPDAATYCDRGLLYLHLSKPRQAESDLRSIERMTGSASASASYHALLAGALAVYSGKVKSALPLLSNVLKQNPTWKQAYVLRAHCYEKLGQPALAAKDKSVAATLGDLADLVIGG